VPGGSVVCVLFIVVAYGLLLPETVLAVPKLGCINVHASLLPKYRGAAPIQRAIASGETQTGISIMQMDKGLDSGDILLQKSCPITQEETGGTLHDKLAKLGAECLLTSLQQIKQLHPTQQDEKQATYAQKLTKQEGKIDWTQNAQQIDCHIRAFNPWPVTFTNYQENRIRIWQATINKTQTTEPPGTIIALTKQGIEVATGKNTLLITKLQLPGGKILTAQEVLNANKLNFEPGKSFN